MKLSEIPYRWKLFVIIGLVTIVADQASKIWARESLPTQQTTHSMLDKPCEIPDDIVSHKCVGTAVKVIDGYWEWRLSFNPGSAFGLFNSATGARVFLSIIGVLAVAGMVWMLKRAKDRQKPLIWALGLVAGGAIGNLIDRVYYGVVTDFVLWKYKSHEWPVFNVADVALVVGVGLMFFDIGGDPKKKKKKSKVEA